MVKKKQVKVDDYLNIDKLLKDYEPLMKSIYKRFSKYNNLYFSKYDFEDLESQIQFEFVRLCYEYNPARGIDFPGFIKFHLQQRVFHYITKANRVNQRETVVYKKEYDGTTSESIDFDNSEEVIDKNSTRGFEKVEALTCVDWEELEPEQQKIVFDVLYNNKSLEDIASEQNISMRSINCKLNKICEYFVEQHNKQELLYSKQTNLYYIRTSINVVRIPFIIRVPIVGGYNQ